MPGPVSALWAGGGGLVNGQVQTGSWNTPDTHPGAQGGCHAGATRGVPRGGEQVCGRGAGELSWARGPDARRRRAGEGREDGQQRWDWKESRAGGETGCPWRRTVVPWGFEPTKGLKQGSTPGSELSARPLSLWNQAQESVSGCPWAPASVPTSASSPGNTGSVRGASTPRNSAATSVGEGGDEQSAGADSVERLPLHQPPKFVNFRSYSDFDQPLLGYLRAGNHLLSH